MDPIAFVIIAVVVYFFFRPKNKSGRTADPTGTGEPQHPQNSQYPQNQYPRNQYPQNSQNPQNPQNPPRRRGILANLEEMFRESQADPYGSAPDMRPGPEPYASDTYSGPYDSDRYPDRPVVWQPVPQQPIPQRPVSQAPTSQPVAKAKPAILSNPGARQAPAANREDSSNDIPSQNSQSPGMHKNPVLWKGLTMERTGIVEGFIWSQILGDPVSRRTPRAHRR